ncbi:hypothetical protein KBA73_00345 [Patescibacteria group bacterium]|nr:hypothetical protein [Patescibacteria group bacterium]
MSAQPRSLVQLLLVRQLGSILEFPLWWYSRGVILLLQWAEQEMSYAWREKALGLWARNLFTPMYGDWSWSGRALSVLMRFVVMAARSVSLIVQTMFYLIVLALWLLLPVVALGLLIRPLGQSFLSLLF